MARQFDKAIRRFLECFSNRAMAKLIVRADELNHRLIFRGVANHAHRIFASLDAGRVVVNLRPIAEPPREAI